MRLNILRRGDGLGGRGRENGFGSGRGGAFMICLLWGTTALGMKLDIRHQLDKREPEPQRARVTEWVTVTMQGGWRVTEYSTTTITPTAASEATAIVTVTSIITTGTTITNTLTTTTVVPAATITAEPFTTTTSSPAPTTTTSAITFTSQIGKNTTTDTNINTIINTNTNTNINTNTASSTSTAVAASTVATLPVTETSAAGAGTPVSKSGDVTVAAIKTPQPKNGDVVIVTDIVTGDALATSTVTKVPTVTTTATNWANTWGQGGPVRRRQAAQETITLTATTWNWQDGVTTSVITEYATSTGMTAGVSATMAIPTTVTTTIISTQVSTYTTQQTVTTTETTPLSTAETSSQTLIVDDAQSIGEANPKTPNVEVIIGACFGALVGFIAIFVLAYIWTKKRRDENLRKESVGFSNGSFLRSSPGAGSGVRGMIGSLRHGPSTKYNNIPSGESMPNMSPLPAPPHSPPPQLPQLRVMPPSGEFNYEYTFGSPVSSIGEAQLHALTSGAISPPAVGQEQRDEMFFDLPHQQSEHLPWSSPAVETRAAETVVSSVSAQSDGPVPSSSVSISVSGTQSSRREPVPVAADYVVSP